MELQSVNDFFILFFCSSGWHRRQRHAGGRQGGRHDGTLQRVPQRWAKNIKTQIPILKCFISDYYGIRFTEDPDEKAKKKSHFLENQLPKFLTTSEALLEKAGGEKFGGGDVR